MKYLGEYQGYKVYAGEPHSGDYENLWLYNSVLWFADQWVGSVYAGTLRVKEFDEDKIRAIEQARNKKVVAFTSASAEVEESVAVDELDEFFKGLSKNVDEYLEKVTADGIEF